MSHPPAHDPLHPHGLLPPGGAVLVGLALAALAMLPSPTARAESLRDPTRPASPSAAAMPAAGAAASAASATASGSPHQLQATQRRIDGRWAALINDRWLEVGASLGDGRIASISEADVVLTRGSERLTLTLLPARKQARSASPTRTSP